MIITFRRRASVLPVCLALFGASSACAQFVRQSPWPTGRSLGGVAFTSPTHGFVVGQNHTLMETFDGGLTWTKRMGDAFSSDPFYTILFSDPLHGYIAGNNQDAYRTTDGGQTWTRMTTMLAGSVRELDFITPTTGFAGYNGAIAWTPNGGATWQLRSGYPDAPIVFGMDFRDETVGLASGIRSTPYHDGGIYRTEDGGASWTLVYDGGVNDVLWIDSTTAVAVDGLDAIRSDDEGRTWYPVSTFGLLDGVSDLARAGASSTLGAVSGAGDIWLSLDLGYSWFPVVEGLGVLPASWAINFLDEMNGWVVGDQGLTYRTTDGGWTWQLLNNGCGNEVTALDFADDDFGIAVTYHGFVFRTFDRGGHWAVTRLRETGEVFGRHEGLEAVDILDESTVFVGGAGGLFYRSDDAGTNWTSLGYPYGQLAGLDITAIKFTDGLNGWVAGLGGADTALYRTTDGGFFFTPIDTVVGSIVAIDAEADRVWAITAGTRIYRSTDSGDTFAWQTMPGNVYYLNDLDFVDADNGFVVGRFGYMARSVNGGASWTPMEYAQNENYYDVTMTSPTDILIVGYDSNSFRGFLKRSTNGGASWSRTDLNPQFEESFSELHARPGGRYWLAGQAGAIVYSPAPPLTITLPAGIPPQVPPMLPSQFAVRIVAGEEQIVDGSQTLWLRRAPAAAFEPVALTRVSGDDYLAALPPLACTDTPQFYLEAAGTGGTTVRHPAGAPANYLTTRVGVIEDAELLALDFEAGLPAGWTATGLWHVTSTACLPTGACGSGAWAYFGQDSNCTFNTGARVAGVLRSPNFTLPALQAGQHIGVSFCSALDTEYPDGAYGDDDQAQLWWVRSTGQAAPIHWFTDHRTARTQSFNLDLHAGTTGRLEWRFDSMNTYMNAFRGWHVDNIRVVGPALVCDSGGAPGDIDGDGDVDLQDLATLLSAFGSCAGDANFNLAADFDASGCIALQDLATLLANFGA